MRPFDVRFTSCSVPGDRDRLLAVIESCGNGVETFNAWMHDLLPLSDLYKNFSL